MTPPPASARSGAARAVGLALALALAAASCATPPRGESGAGNAGAPASPPGGRSAAPASAASTGAAPAAAGRASSADPRGKAPSDSAPAAKDALRDAADAYLSDSLARFREARADGGAAAAALRLAGRDRAALLLSVKCGRSPSGYMDAATAELVLEAYSRGPALAAALKAAGAGFAPTAAPMPDAASLSISCPASSIEAVARELVSGLASPSLEREAFELARRKLLLSELRKEGDPSSRASAEFLSAEFLSAGRLGGEIPGDARFAGRGEASGADLDRDASDYLNRITLAQASSWWASAVGADRVSLVAVGELDPLATVAGLARILGEWPARAGAGAAARPVPASATAAASASAREGASRGYPRSVPLTSMPGSAMLASLLAPPRAGESASDAAGRYGPTLVALGMLEDLLGRELPITLGRDCSIELRLPGSPGDAAVLTVRGTSDPVAAKSAVEKAIAILASGYCAPENPGDPPAAIASRLGCYKSRALVGFYSGASTGAIAERIAYSIARGDDGSDYFRAASRIASTRAEDVVVVARERLSGNGSAWLALGDPAVLRAMGGSATASAAP